MTERKSLNLDRQWTLFLDRDGVLNIESIGSYITSWEEFHFCEGVPEAIRMVSQIFGRIIVVSNQRGVGRGIMTIEDLKDISQKMKEAIGTMGGRIDKAYAATAVDQQDHNRKPNVGMALQAKEDFPEIDFHKSVMIGNSISDMEFGKRLAMHTVFLTTRHKAFPLPHDLIDEQYPSFYAWTKTLRPAFSFG